jgi:ribosomal protein S18 acetylase RimI-like enzyme
VHETPERASPRRARPDDLDALLILYDELVDDPGESTRAEEPPARAAMEAILRDRSRHLAVVTVGGRVAGTADLLVVANLTHRAQPWAIIENVVVAAAHRRAGIGRALMSHLFEVAREAGCYKVQLLSGKHRTEAHSFYRSVGFEAVAEGFKLYLDTQRRA